MLDTATLEHNKPNQRSKKAVKPGSDAGTVTLHWLTVISLIVSLLTGLRISADGLTNHWAAALDPILPQGEIWTWHIAASITLIASTAAYFIYVRRAVLGARNAPSRLKTLTPPTTSRLRWRAINVALHWFAYAAILALTVTGIALYLGYASLFLTLHTWLAWAMLAYIAIHSLTHFLYGGIAQLLRLFRPEPLLESFQTKVWPFGIAMIVAITTAAAAVGLDWTTRPTITALAITSTPTLDGVLDEPFWAMAETATIETHQGANLGGTGSSSVSIKATVNEDTIHFAFLWQDPTRSLMRSPVVKSDDGWRVISTGAAQADVNDYYEDKFAVLFSLNDQLGGGGSTYLGKDPLPNYPKSPHQRGLHYTDDGRILDLWQWKSSRGGMLGYVDDMHFGPPLKATPAQEQGKKRYAAGYTSDPGKAIYEYNYIADGANGYDSPVRLKRLPRDLAAMRLALGRLPRGADGDNAEGSKWWMTRDDSVPYHPALDAAIPIGTVLPTTLNIHQYNGDRADLSGGARWRDGIWTLEVSRKRDTGSPYDMAFHKGRTIYVWLSVFDHNQTRHTRHQRPVTLVIPN
ncbi:ethylbenzene dehydrogenase-related protein [Pseudahrensia aquimaris]|uniref:Ethylbenzene dehydrogenase-related protein n=1 Tax=Pseudahrensia aquimaris TaxID=744461 RepID=A0ABW3FDZ6_9HYPH